MAGKLTTTQNTADAFFARVNPTTGITEWFVQDQEYDYHQEVARSAYADMLHDDERNKKYYAGIREAVKIIHDRGLKAHVLDIGTGTGLLSMMAAEAGAEMVTACEAFEPMARTAKVIIKKNGFADRIKVVSKRSKDMTVGPDGDMPYKANILATEVFDTELIGEGAIPTYKHALEHLLEEDCIAVPSSATVIAQVVESDKLWKLHKIQPIRLASGGVITPPADMQSCPGPPSAYDFHLDELSCDQFQPITAPVEVLHFPYSKGMIKCSDCKTFEMKSLRSGKSHAVLMWWTLQMDTQGKILLSTEPHWASNKPYTTVQWRDHWIQAAYYLPQEVYVQKGEVLKLTASHDDYSLWFDVKNGTDTSPLGSERPECKSIASIVCSRQRIGMINDKARQDKYTAALRQVIRNDSIVLSVSDCSFLPLLAARLGAKKVYTLENRFKSNSMIDQVLTENGLHDNVTVVSKRAEELTAEDLDNQKVDILIGEPYFMNSILPWHNLYFWFAKCELSDLSKKDVTVMPGMATLRAIAVEFDHLWKIRAPVRNLEGFDVTPFDDLVQKSMNYSDKGAEAQPLWEYPSRPLTQDFDLLTFDFTKPIPEKDVSVNGTIDFRSSGTCHGVVLWMEYALDGDTKLSTGLLQPPQNFKDKLTFDPYTQQGVFFLTDNQKVDVDTEQRQLNYLVNFDPKIGDLTFRFEIS
ncbi:protein arginine N-methyltransferase 7-like [Ptychodera flava]|uniref:protein arginine N-methyltransferase 7-like n=1 Tax=Ptychodera flava TaxID=63121 RepID=UPI00396A5F9B